MPDSRPFSSAAFHWGLVTIAVVALVVVVGGVLWLFKRRRRRCNSFMLYVSFMVVSFYVNLQCSHFISARQAIHESTEAVSRDETWTRRTWYVWCHKKPY